MNLWLTLGVNSVALGGLLFLLSSGFSLIFGLMRIPNLMHGSFFMLGAYFGVTLLWKGFNFWAAALLSAAAIAVIGGLIERFLLRRLEGQILPQVLLTLVHGIGLLLYAALWLALPDAPGQESGLDRLIDAVRSLLGIEPPRKGGGPPPHDDDPGDRGSSGGWSPTRN